MDGSPSAADFHLEHPQLTDETSRPTDAERELKELRARAYGPQADIASDPTAMARLIELEAARRIAATAARGDRRGADSAPSSPMTEADSKTVDAPSSPSAGSSTEQPHASSEGPRLSVRQRAAGMPRRALWMIAAVAAVGVVTLVAAGTTWLLTPHPDATLQATAFDPDSGIIEVLDAQGKHPERSTLRQFEPYHDVDLWSVESAKEKTCLVAWDRRSGRYGAKCVPRRMEAVLSLGVGPDDSDGFGEWLGEPSIVSFHLRGNTVDVFVRPRSQHPSPAAQPASASESFTRPPMRSSEFS